jgi:membrane protein YdbS with pleckstrin-like domain
VIPLNSRQFLPAKAFWYFTSRALLGAAVLLLFARFWHFLATSPSARCTGALCGSNGALAEWMMYLLASIMLFNSILQFKSFSFILTDHSVTIDSGLLVQKSRVIRFDKIQDVESRRNLLHMLLGLKSVAIWTASLDQSRGNTRRPDGLIVLEADSADWLAGFLIAPDRTPHDPAREDIDEGRGAAPRGLQRNVGLLIGFLLGIALVWGVWRRSGDSAPPAAAAGAAPSVSSAPAAAAEQAAIVHPTPETYAANSAALPGDYTIACAANSTGPTSAVAACNGLKWGQRCEHEADFRSNPTAESTRVVIANRSNQSIKLYWLDPLGQRNQYAVLPPGRKIGQPSRIGAHWLVTTADERCVGIFNADTARIGIF